MVLVIDTSSARSGLALLASGEEGYEPAAEEVFPSSRGDGLARRARRLAPDGSVDGVLVALGPGSFTGVRVGVSYGVGLAMGLGVPLWGVGSLDLIAARSEGPVTALTEAGRGRVCFRVDGGEERLGEPTELPRDRPAAGWLRETTAAAVRAAGIRLLEEPELLSFAAGAARAMGSACRLGYGRVALRYLSSVGRLEV
ncbi:MAG TPA: tRNA (adenosine(37)-N6)-threonylcarbamoyltransferase complex dimerization subunit type 1 TsaB [Candidatus Dormibacteraeota bacterium]|jgi:tRNA threonylcarbamoyl adenosine modification protein YeaZ|nr:tRNA (adenosine(37)-N6)-threonylcarbamoyltransferase complex dimerization subunit type 1 TsaB [Candidatus Dormibacteraeota bacterium]